MQKGFIQRAQYFVTECKANRFPNAGTLIRKFGVSESTATRVIERLKSQHAAPLHYDNSRKGYFLSDIEYTLEPIEAVDRDELAALLLIRCMIEMVPADDLGSALNNIWSRSVASINGVSEDLEKLSRFFSSDLTVVGNMADREILKYVVSAYREDSIQLGYKSPWRHNQEQTYQGQVQHVHFSDGSFYLNFLDTEGNSRILNCSFIKNFEILSEKLEITPNPDNRDRRDSTNWRSGFGIWAGAELEDIEIQILPPASEYYAAQKWHADQVDTWDGDVLVRRFKAIVSPELERRVLSVGKYVKGVKPEGLNRRIVEQAKDLISGLS